MRKGERSQEKHFHVNARKLNSHLTVLTRATEAFLLARAEGNDPVAAVLTSVPERELQSTVDSAKQLLRPENLDSLDLIESRYTPMRQSLLSLYAADIWVPFGKPQVIGTNEEALYVIDALCHHESDLHIREHYADTGGSTEHVFALASLLGFRFAPRISNALSKKLYLPGELGVSESLSTLVFEQVNKKLIGLNKGEALHALARQLFFGRLGELRDRALEDQIHRASCLHLLMAAIAAWNTIYLTEVFATLRRQGEEIAETTVAHIAPLGWEHINLIGKYHFAPQPGRSLENLRPLRRSEREEEAPQEAVS